ncbi:MAG: hypothetical protein DMF81_10945 [Acidobacteria bacterium]|nr:MAG: hypothetical protein DMF81_10945 [Acidobacteriota bacterium]
MRLLASPGFAAAGAVLLGAALHPALRSLLRPPLVAVAATALLLALALLIRPGGPGERLVGLGAVAIVGALASDGLRGHRGTLTLEVGQGTQSFEEQGPEGRALGRRPLGFGVVLARLDPGGAVVLRAGDGATIAPGRRRAASHGGFRFGLAAGPGGQPSVLRIAIAGPGGSRMVEVAPGEPATADGLHVALESYFPDFALDAERRPYSRSPEPRNPAALLRVTRGSQSWRVFVIQAMPGIHRPEGLDRVLSLAGVAPRGAASLRVSHEPAAPVALAGALLAAAGVACARR